VLITAPSITSFFAATANSVEVLGANAGGYQYDDGVLFTGTIGAGDLISRPNATTAIFYIGSNVNVSSNNNEYQYWYLFADGVQSYRATLTPTYCGILSYDGTTKQVTVEWGTADVPTIGGTWRLVRDYPIIRKGQWKRNSVAISGETSRAYAVRPADAGQSITYEETVGFADWAWRQTGTDAAPSPTVSLATASAAYVPSTSLTSSTKITNQTDFTYIGSFKISSTTLISKMSVVPASQSQNGLVSLLLSAMPQNSGNGTREISIPALSTNSNPTLLNTATETRFSSDIYDGWCSTAKTGFANGPIVSGQVGLTGTSNLIAGNIGYYTGQLSNYFVKRPSDITTSATLNPFCIYPTNTGKGRWAGGSIVEIPTALQSSLGGDLLAGSGVGAIAGANSQTPAGMVFSSSDIDAAIAKYETGTTASSGSATTAFLAATASSTPNYYLNWQVVFNISGSTTGNTGYVIAYNHTTKQITFASIGTSVPSGATYSLIAPVYSKQVYGNATPYEPDSKDFPYMWNTAGGSFNFSTFIPRGTTSFVNVTTAWSGKNSYGLWVTFPGVTGRYWGGLVVDSGPRLYTEGPSPDGTSPGPRQASQWPNPSNNYCLFWVYDASDLASVVSGAKTYDQITPFSVFTFELPYAGISDCQSVAFDNVNNRMYVYQKIYTYSYGLVNLVHVYSCNKYS
jgi:hypothetical protein